MSDKPPKHWTATRDLGDFEPYGDMVTVVISRGWYFYRALKDGEQHSDIPFLLSRVSKQDWDNPEDFIAGLEAAERWQYF